MHRGEMIPCAFLDAQRLLLADWTVVQSQSFCKCEARRPGEEEDPGETSKSGGGISGQNRVWVQAEYGGKAKQSYTKHSGCRMGENICKSCLIKDLYVEYKFKQRMFKTQ